MRLLAGNRIFTLNEAADVVTRRDVLENDIARCGAKERDSGADEHGKACDNESLDKSGLKKPLDSDPTIYVNMPDAASCNLRHDFRRIPRHTLHHSPGGGGMERVRAERENWPGAVRPRVKGQYLLESIAANDQRIHSGNEFIVAVGLVAAGR